MNARSLRFLAATVLWVAVSACATVPLTGRTQFSLVSPGTMLSMSRQQYGDFLKNNPLSDDQKSAAMVREVGGNIQKAVERYFTQQGMAGQLQNYAWEFNLIESDEVNAWCMPGGKIAVYTGILPVTKDHNGLAVVLGHEIGHAVAGHGSERMSQLLAVQMGGIALSAAIADRPQSTQQLWFAAFGLGSQVGVILPYSRLQEYEADRLGLVFMAMAGYDPDGAVAFWERLAAKKEGKGPPAFLSTHPTDEARIAKMKSILPEARRYYRERR